jgi:hypothetical protein
MRWRWCCGSRDTHPFPVRQGRVQTQPYEVQKDMSWRAALPLSREIDVRIRMDLLTWPHMRIRVALYLLAKQR